MAKKKQKSYEEALHELEGLLNKVEGDEVSIDELSDMVQQSVELIKTCKNQLKGIEKNINDSFSAMED